MAVLTPLAFHEMAIFLPFVLRSAENGCGTAKGI